MEALLDSENEQIKDMGLSYFDTFTNQEGFEFTKHQIQFL
jgi:hypothetical protein